MELKGRTALLTGAGGGIGSAVAENLAKAGVTLVLNGRNEVALEALRVTLPDRDHVILTADLNDREQSSTLIDKAEAAAGPIDILINNAGFEDSGTYHLLETEEIESMVEVNLMAPLLLTHQVIPGMLERGRGHVVQMSSVGGLAGAACTEPYAATKGGLVRFTEALRATYADKPIGFSTVCPGFSTGGGMYTRMQSDGHESNAFIGSTTVDKVAEAVNKGIVKDVPLLVVNSRPLQPILAVNSLAPRVGAKILEASGGNGIFRKLAADRETRAG